MRRRFLLALVLIAGSLAALQAASSPLLAQTPPAHGNQPLNSGGRLHVFPLKGAGPGAPATAHPAEGATAPASACYPGCQPPLVYHGGPVMQSSTVHAIFWLPGGHHYGSGSSDSAFENLVTRYFKDAGGSSFYNILTQYSQDPTTGATVEDGPILNSSTFGGSWVDTNSYGGKGTTANPLLDSDIQAEVAKASSTKHWAAGANTMFFVFTGLDVQSCTDSTHSVCTFAGQAQYCAYHGSGDGTNAPSNVIYANMPDMSDCAALIPVSPNANQYADAVINVTSHEHFEAVTDPMITAWYDDGPSGYEIGDECAWMFGSPTSSGNLTLNGHPYIVQQEWSNADSACVLSYSGPRAPGAPSGVTATAGNGQATVTWVAPSSTGGSPITGYTVTAFVAGVAQTATTPAAPTATTVAVNGLTNGTAYTFTVHATNTVGDSPESSPSNLVTPSATSPMSMSGLAVGGNLCTCNVIVASVGGVPCTSTPPDAYNSSYSLAVACGNAGQAVTFTVNGTSAGLQTSAGATCLIFTPATSVTGLYVFPNQPPNTSCAPTAPGAPTNVTAAAGNGQATVTWLAPSNTGGSPITGYTVTSTPGGITATAAATTGSAAVSGLTNGTTYTFTVTAANLVGTGPASPASNAVTPNTITPPSAPSGVTATAGNGQATVTWVAPSSTGGSPITGYTVTSTPGGITAPAAAAATSIVVSGLTNGTAYTFTVTAANLVGTGPASPASNAVTPAGPVLPGAPSGLTATAGNGQATVTWVAPSSTGGSPITGYTVTSTQGGVTATAAGTATTVAVNTLTNGTAYTFTVHATNTVGDSPESSPSNLVTPSATSPMSMSGLAVGGNLCTCNVIVASVGGVPCTSTPPDGYNSSYSLAVACGNAGQAVTFTVNGTSAGLQTSEGATCLVFTPATSVTGLYVFPNQPPNTSCATASAPASPRASAPEPFPLS